MKGVVTYMSGVEAFATGIKIDSIKQSKPFWRADQGIKVTFKQLKINNQDARLECDL